MSKEAFGIPHGITSNRQNVEKEVVAAVVEQEGMHLRGSEQPELDESQSFPTQNVIPSLGPPPAFSAAKGSKVVSQPAVI